MNNKNLKLILNSFLKHVRVPQVMFPVSRFWEACLPFFPKLLRFSMNRTSRLVGRARIAINFVTLIRSTSKHHGPELTVKWLKASAVCLQKYLGGEKLLSLRRIEPNLPLPRLINGLPAFINKTDRNYIREGNTSVIRFWLTLLNFYRIIDCQGVIKIKTITDPYKGEEDYLKSLITDLESGKSNVFFGDIIIPWAAKLNIAPRWLHFSGSSSPSNKISYKGVLTDIELLLGREVNGFSAKEGPIIYNRLQEYLKSIGSKWNTKPWFKNFEHLEYLAYNLNLGGALPLKGNLTALSSGLAQLSLKKEAAGKIRVFALVDSITQTVLLPLHKALFEILSKIPNDGTFDQELSARRCVEKSKLYNCAFSFDLSAATDRLPVDLTGAILSNIFGLPALGQAWTNLLVDRTYTFNIKQIQPFLKEEPNLINGVRYSTGQPMGALSSWAGLAITHHYIMQLAANNTGQNFISDKETGILTKGWYDKYEVLGDDIVIFDSIVSEEYLRIMALLGVEINLSKSILAPNRDVFEFAKRTYFKGTNVSAVPIKMFFTAHGIAGRVSLAWQFLNSYRLDSLSTINYILAKDPNKQWAAIKFEPLALLSLLIKNNKLEHKSLVESIVDPQFEEEFDLDEVKELTTPSLSIVSQIVQGFKLDNTSLDSKFSLVLPRQEVRSEWTEEFIPFMVDEFLQVALAKIKTFNSLELSAVNLWYKNWIAAGYDFSDDHPEIKILRSQVVSIFEENITNGFSEDTSDFVDKVHDILYNHAKYRNCTLPDAMKVLHDVEIYILSRTPAAIEDAKPTLLVSEHSKHAAAIVRGLYPSKKNYWD